MFSIFSITEIIIINRIQVLMKMKVYVLSWEKNYARVLFRNKIDWNKWCDCWWICMIPLLPKGLYFLIHYPFIYNYFLLIIILFIFSCFFFFFFLLNFMFRYSSPRKTWSCYWSIIPYRKYLILYLFICFCLIFELF